MVGNNNFLSGKNTAVTLEETNLVEMIPTKENLIKMASVYS